jgi:hypothetical protein
MGKPVWTGQFAPEQYKKPQKSRLRRIFMKKIMATLLVAALVVGSAFAGDGWAAKVDIDTDLLNVTDVKGNENSFFKNTGSGNVSYFASADTDIAFTYDDPDGKYGGKINLLTDFNAGPVGKIGDVFAYVKFGSLVKVKAGAFTDRASSKVYGDKDPGLLWFKPGDNNTAAIATSDPFGFGGLTATIYAGPAEVWLLATPITNYRVWDPRKNNPDTGSGTTAEQPKFDDNSNVAADWNNYDTVSDYKFGAAVKFPLPDVVDVAASFKLAHTGSASTTFYTGSESYTYWDQGNYKQGTRTAGALNSVGKWGQKELDFGLYANVKALSSMGLNLGLGAYGSQITADGYKNLLGQGSYKWVEASKYDEYLKLGFDLAVKYTGIDKLTLQLGNNVSFYTDPFDGEDKGTTGADAEYFILYNQLAVGYALSDTLTLDATVRNYLGQVTGANNMKDMKVVKDDLRFDAKLTYKISGNASAFGGVRFDTTSYTYDGYPSGVTDAQKKSFEAGTEANLGKAGYIFSVPVGFTVSW